jgi:hypothetical protein
MSTQTLTAMRAMPSAAARRTVGGGAASNSNSISLARDTHGSSTLCLCVHGSMQQNSISSHASDKALLVMLLVHSVESDSLQSRLYLLLAIGRQFQNAMLTHKPSNSLDQHILRQTNHYILYHDDCVLRIHTHLLSV